MPLFYLLFYLCFLLSLVASTSSLENALIPVLQVYELVDAALPCPWPADLSVMMDFEL